MLSGMFVLCAHCGKRINLASKYISNEKNDEQQEQHSSIIGGVKKKRYWKGPSDDKTTIERKKCATIQMEMVHNLRLEKGEIHTN